MEENTKRHDHFHESLSAAFQAIAWNAPFYTQIATSLNKTPNFTQLKAFGLQGYSYWVVSIEPLWKNTHLST